MSTKPKKTMISLFSGAGGLDLGLNVAGFINKLCVEIDETAQKTLTTNHPKWKLACPGDIHELTPSDLLKQAGLKPRELTLLAGGPPCQPFSKSGFWVTGDTDRLTDPRAKTLKAYLDIVREAQPEVILLENVKGIAFSDKDEGLQLLVNEINKINKLKKTNYKPHVISLNAADYGVPQSRERVFIVASRDGVQFNLPEPTHFSPDAAKGNGKPHLTAWDAIGDLDVDIWPDNVKPSGKWADLLPTIPEGQNYLWHTDKLGGLPLFGWRTRYWSFLLKLAKNKPSWTIQAQPGPATGPFHWKGRLLSIRELARLQTFPDDYQFLGERRAAQMQIGNAVPPAIGEFFGLEIRRQFFGERVRRKLRLIPVKRTDCPSPEAPKPVPSKYFPLSGAHSAHPGTGKGPRAQKREQKEQVNAR
ncbi:DNA cytosine methyltransferase [Photobacterium sp. ZSDE20]|uniref:DNA (cytosine-5-)-methyltransferase n=1 Tax=Photobacterium pectinilyticum TaxID=2906793 RepID=A0ABT1N8F9_9GAMM|nr:DNA (cytosine-5-)-methyltransferase [Photobacterium sp. ZSDE20]MCQ1059966.1 DNA cytosine methyltransferase [Photobacterium sp. ZSDE20]MDD1826810.1 DNA cytosine methyltransferase [Photobacterium sp. ZSDE20]